MPSTNIEVDLDLTTWKTIPVVDVLLDNVIVQSISLSGPTTITTCRDLIDGTHCLQIQINGKTMADTIVDEHNNIKKDVLVHIKKIRIDSVDLKLIPWSIGTFIAKQDDLDAPTTPIPHIVDIGWNGTWAMNFDVPTYLWALSHM